MCAAGLVVGVGEVGALEDGFWLSELERALESTSLGALESPSIISAAALVIKADE